MSLMHSQEALYLALWSDDGLNVLKSQSNWQKFVANNPVVIGAYEGHEKKLSLYERLIQTTVQDTLNTFFPYCKHLLADDWTRLSELFRRSHPNRSYQLYRCAENFPTFLANQQAWVQRYPFLPELALYEWLEVDVENAREQIFPAQASRSIPNTVDKLTATAPIWNNASDLRIWSYPVPQVIEAMNSDLQTQANPKIWQATTTIPQKETTYFIYRDTQTHRARFFELNALTAQLIALSQKNPQASYKQSLTALKQSNAALANISIDIVLIQSLPLLKNCQEANVLLGSVPVLPVSIN